MIRFACPECHAMLQAAEGAAGSRVACSRCGQQLQLPAAPAKAPIAPPCSPTPPLATLVGTQSPSASSKPPVRSLWQRLVAEMRAIGTDTFGQTLRPPAYLGGLWRCRSLRRSARAAEIGLGQRLYESQAGDADLRGRIRALDERIHSGWVSAGTRGRLDNQRQALLLQLAVPALAAGTPPPGAEAEYTRASEARAALQAHERNVKQVRAGLLPAGWTGWRRVAIGYAVAAGLLFLAAAAPFALRRAPAGPPPPQRQPVAQPPAPRLPLTTEQIVATSEKSVALLRCGKMTGTGFLVRPGLLATNAHVIRFAPIEQLKIHFPSAEGATRGPIAVKRLRFEDPKRDLAFLEVESPLPVLPIAPAYTFKRGQSVTVIGNPSLGADINLQNAVSQGLMSTETKLNDHEFYQLSIAVNPGNSGGPVFDSTGQVIGVVTMKAARQEGVAFCVPCKDLTFWLAKAQRQEPEVVARATPQHDLEVVFRRLALAGSMHLEAIRAYLIAARRAQAQGAPPAAGMEVAKKSLAKSLEQGDQEWVEELKDTVTQVGSNPLIEEALRNQVLEMQATYRDIKKHAKETSGELQGYADRAKELNDKYKLLIDALKAALHIDEAE
jgi:S1-C subfamily serine protease